jgi:hypothetical protein
VFIRWLIVIQLLGLLLSGFLSWQFDAADIYADFELSQYGPLALLLTLASAGAQVFIIAVAFLLWSVETYRVNPDVIIHQRANFFGANYLAKTQTISDITVRQSRLGRGFNYGTLELTTLNGPRSMRDVPSPMYHASLISDLIKPQLIDASRELQKPIPYLLTEGEGQYVEYKASFSWDYRQQRVNKDLNKAVMKNVVGFMNTTGGMILLGVDDDGAIVGLETEFQAQGKPNADGFENNFNIAFNNMVGAEYRHYLRLDFAEFEGKTVGRLLVLPTPEPVFLKQKGEEEFYIRTGNSSQPLSLSQAVKYIQNHFK